MAKFYGIPVPRAIAKLDKTPNCEVVRQLSNTPCRLYPAEQIIDVGQPNGLWNQLKIICPMFSQACWILLMFTYYEFGPKHTHR